MEVPASLEEYISALASEASASRLRLAAVGGCVRDWMLGRPSKDLDLVVEGEPEPLLALCRTRWGAAVQAFGMFGTYRLFLNDGFRLDVARARRETYASPGALPWVRPATLEEDLSRRDFSVNAMALVLPERRLLDPMGGQRDLLRRRLRILHPASFRDDPTRIFRAARFAGRFDFRVESGTQKALVAAVARGHLAKLSRERLRQELWRVLQETDPLPALRLLKRWRALDAIQPGLRWSLRSFAETDPAIRLGVLAGLQGEQSDSFLAGLHADRVLAQAIRRALGVVRDRRAPRMPLSDFERRVVRGLRPHLPESALQPLMAGGDDLKQLGLPPGASYARVLADLARAQWEGRVADRAQALLWLEARVKDRRP